MWISESKVEKLKSFYTLLNPRLRICNPQLRRFFPFHQQHVLFLLVLLLLSLSYFRLDHALPPPEEKTPKVMVEVSGEVGSPGIYSFQQSPTLREVLDKAGGMRETASFSLVSSAELLETGSLVTVARENPDEIKVKLERMETIKLLVFSIPLDLNRASEGDLCHVPGIGEALAREIIAYRARRKAFRSVEELKKVKGVGEKKYRSLKSFLTVTP
jgi:competence protein ComEA